MFSPLENVGNALIILKNSERHHSISKSHHSSTYSRFKGIFVHPDDIFSGKFLQKICITLSYLSIATWITQFGHLWTKLSSKQENCSNLKSCDSWNLWHVDDSWMIHDSWQKARLTTHAALTSHDRREGGWLVNTLTTRAALTSRDRREGGRLVNTLTTREHSKLSPFGLRSFNLHSSKSKTRSKHLSKLKHV